MPPSGDFRQQSASGRKALESGSVSRTLIGECDQVVHRDGHLALDKGSFIESVARSASSESHLVSLKKHYECHGGEGLKNDTTTKQEQEALRPWIYNSDDVCYTVRTRASERTAGTDSLSRG